MTLTNSAMAKVLVTALLTVLTAQGYVIERVPVAVGVKVTVMVQLAPADCAARWHST